MKCKFNKSYAILQNGGQAYSSLQEAMIIIKININLIKTFFILLSFGKNKVKIPIQSKLILCF